MENNVTKLREDISLCKQKIRECLDYDSETLYVYVELLKALRKEINALGLQCFTIGKGVQENTIEDSFTYITIGKLEQNLKEGRYALDVSVFVFTNLPIWDVIQQNFPKSSVNPIHNGALTLVIAR
jgi:hypothetical protein